MGREVATSGRKKIKYFVIETVGAGAAITPKFDSEEALIEHLVKFGTDWDKPIPREIAERFVKEVKFVPSMAMTSQGITPTPYHCVLLMEKKDKKI